MKKTLVLLMTILLLCLTAGALANNEVEFKPGPDDLTVEEAHARAAASSARMIPTTARWPSAKRWARRCNKHFA